MKATTATSSVDRLFRAFSDRTRLRILNILRQGEFCVNDLAAITGVPQPTASRHLAYLRKSGLVTTDKQGLWIHYSLAPARDAFHRKLLECLDCCFKNVPELTADAKRAAEIQKNGGCCPR